MRIVLFSILVALFLSCGEDSLFCTYPEVTSATSIVSDYSDGYYLGCHRITGSSYEWEGYIYRIDSQGKVVWKIALPDVSGVPSMVHGDSSSCIALCNIESENGRKISLMCVDSDGEIVWENDYNEIPYVIGNKLISSSDGGYLAAGSAGRFDNIQGLLVKFAHDGSVVWSRTYSQNQLSFFSDVIEIDSGYAALGRSMNTDYEGDALLVITDNSGNESLIKSIDVIYSSGGNRIVPTSNGYLVLCGTYARDHIDPIIVFLDDSFDMIDYRNYGAVSLVELPRDLEVYTNNSYAIMVYRSTADQTSSGVYMIEINSNGDVIRQREFFSNSGHLIPLDLLVLSDSSIVFCGDRLLPDQEFSKGSAFIMRCTPKWQM